MKAAQIDDYNSQVIINEVEKPIVETDHVLVEVYAASLNPFDSKVRSGAMKDYFSLEFPITLGGDIAGIVSEIGSGVDHVAVGDKVYGQANVVAGNSGAFAEFARTKSSQIALAPKNIEFETIATLPLVGCSALQAITKHLMLSNGQKIFIHGGAGGIGSIAIQIAKNIGAYVATTATGDNIELVKQLGADEVIDFKSQNFADILSSYDAVFDTVGGDDFNKSFSILKPESKAVTMIADVDEALATQKGITAMRQDTRVTIEALNELRELVDSGVVTSRIGRTFPLEAVADAFNAREMGAVNGKIVLKIK